MKANHYLNTKEGTVYFKLGKFAFHFFREPNWNGSILCVSLITDFGMFIIQVGKLVMGVYW